MYMRQFFPSTFFLDIFKLFFYFLLVISDYSRFCQSFYINFFEVGFHCMPSVCYFTSTISFDHKRFAFFPSSSACFYIYYIACLQFVNYCMINLLIDFDIQ